MRVFIKVSINLFAAVRWNYSSSRSWQRGLPSCSLSLGNRDTASYTLGSILWAGRKGQLKVQMMQGLANGDLVLWHFALHEGNNCVLSTGVQEGGRSQVGTGLPLLKVLMPASVLLQQSLTLRRSWHVVEMYSRCWGKNILQSSSPQGLLLFPSTCHQRR